MMLQKLVTAQSAYSVQQLRYDFDKHRMLSEMISRKSGSLDASVARSNRKSNGEEIDERTAVLVQNILERRDKRIGGSKPQTANPSLPSLRDTNRPSTCFYESNPSVQNRPEEHFPPPRELVGVDYPLV